MYTTLKIKPQGQASLAKKKSTWAVFSSYGIDLLNTPASGASASDSGTASGTLIAVW